MGILVVWLLLSIRHVLAARLNVGLSLRSFWKTGTQELPFSFVLFKFLMRYWEVIYVLVDPDSVCAGSAFLAVQTDSGPVGWMCLWHWVFWVHWLAQALGSNCLMFLTGTHILCLGFGFGILDLSFWNLQSFWMSTEPLSSPWEGQGKATLAYSHSLTATLIKAACSGAPWGCTVHTVCPCSWWAWWGPRLDLEHPRMPHY